MEASRCCCCENKTHPHRRVHCELFWRALKCCGKFTALFINAGECCFSKNENELETCSAVYSLFTIDHFLYYIFFILSQEKKNTLFGQYDKLHNLNVKQQRVRVNELKTNTACFTHTEWARGKCAFPTALPTLGRIFPSPPFSGCKLQQRSQGTSAASLIRGRSDIWGEAVAKEKTTLEQGIEQDLHS